MNRLKKIRQLAILNLLVVLPALSYSFDYVYGYTPNAALFGNTWQMNTQVLGAHGKDGMDISAVIYQYEAVKNLADDFTVTVGNENSDADGYLWSDTEDWSQKYGMKIRKVVPIGYTPLAAFGEGSIATTGQGQVKDPVVQYLYRFDACFDPSVSSTCAGYKPPVPVIPEVVLYDPLNDESLKEANKKTDSDLYDDEEEEIKESDEDQEEEDRLELAFFQADHALMLTNEITQDALILAMNSVADMSSYYLAQIPSNVYRETISMKDKGISDNKKAWRSLSQDKRHYQLVKEQYENN